MSELSIRSAADLAAALPAAGDPLYARLDGVQTDVGAVAYAFLGPSGDANLGANFGCYARFTPTRRVAVNRTVIRVGTQSGNLDLGIFSDDAGEPGAKLFTLGSTPVPAAGRAAIVIPETLLDLSAVYWFGIALDNATATVAVNSRGGAFVNFRSQAAAFPLPDTPAGAALGTAAQTCFSLERG